MTRKYKFKCEKIIYKDHDSIFTEIPTEFIMEVGKEISFQFITDKIFEKFQILTITEIKE